MKARLFSAAARGLYGLGLSGAVEAVLPRLSGAARRPAGTQGKAQGTDPEGRAYQVLNYHRVNDLGEAFALAAIHPRDFESQIRYLRRHYRILPLAELLLRAEEDRLPPRALAITFDDGYADNHRFAFPVLRKYGVPATLFAVTGCLETREPLWYDKVFHAFRSTRKTRCALPGLMDADSDIGDLKARRAVCERGLVALKRLPEPQRLERMTALFSELGVSDFSPLRDLMLGWEEVRELDAGGFSVEAHTVSHPILSQVTPARLQEEISGCKRALEAKLQREIALFAYPNGQPEDYTPEAARTLAAHGFRYAFTTVFGKNKRASDPFGLKRAMPWYHDISRFALCQAIIHATL